MWNFGVVVLCLGAIFFYSPVTSETHPGSVTLELEAPEAKSQVKRSIASYRYTPETDDDNSTALLKAILQNKELNEVIPSNPSAKNSDSYDSQLLKEKYRQKLKRKQLEANAEMMNMVSASSTLSPAPTTSTTLSQQVVRAQSKGEAAGMPNIDPVQEETLMSAILPGNQPEKRVPKTGTMERERAKTKESQFEEGRGGWGFQSDAVQQHDEGDAEVDEETGQFRISNNRGRREMSEGSGAKLEESLVGKVREGRGLKDRKKPAWSTKITKGKTRKTIGGRGKIGGKRRKIRRKNRCGPESKKRRRNKWNNDGETSDGCRPVRPRPGNGCKPTRPVRPGNGCKPRPGNCRPRPRPGGNGCRPRPRPGRPGNGCKPKRPAGNGDTRKPCRKRKRLRPNNRMGLSFKRRPASGRSRPRCAPVRKIRKPQRRPQGNKRVAKKGGKRKAGQRGQKRNPVLNKSTWGLGRKRSLTETSGSRRSRSDNEGAQDLARILGGTHSSASDPVSFGRKREAGNGPLATTFSLNDFLRDGDGSSDAAKLVVRDVKEAAEGRAQSREDELGGVRGRGLVSGWSDKSGKSIRSADQKEAPSQAEINRNTKAAEVSLTAEKSYNAKQPKIKDEVDPTRMDAKKNNDGTIPWLTPFPEHKQMHGGKLIKKRSIGKDENECKEEDKGKQVHVNQNPELHFKQEERERREDGKPELEENIVAENYDEFCNTMDNEARKRKCEYYTIKTLEPLPLSLRPDSIIVTSNLLEREDVTAIQKNYMENIQIVATQNRILAIETVKAAIWEPPSNMNEMEPKNGFQLLNTTKKIFGKICPPYVVPTKLLNAAFNAFRMLHNITTPKRGPFISDLEFGWIDNILQECAANVHVPKYGMDTCNEEVLKADRYALCLGYMTISGRNRSTACYQTNMDVLDPILDIIWIMFETVKASCFDYFQGNVRLFHRYTNAIMDLYTRPLKFRWGLQREERDFWNRIIGPGTEAALRNIDKCAHYIIKSSKFNFRTPRFFNPNTVRLSHTNTEFLEVPLT